MAHKASNINNKYITSSTSETINISFILSHYALQAMHNYLNMCSQANKYYRLQNGNHFKENKSKEFYKNKKHYPAWSS